MRSARRASSSSNSSTSRAFMRSTGSPYWRICESAIRRRACSRSRLALRVVELLVLVVVLVVVVVVVIVRRPSGESSRRLAMADGLGL